MRSVLFICTGNICRSPTAEGVFRKMVADAGLAHAIRVDSAGTHAYHVGEPPDTRSQAFARARGYDLSGIRARRIDTGDFGAFDLILGWIAITTRFLRGWHRPSRVRRST